MTEQHRHIIGNLVAHPDGLVALENLPLGVGQGEQGVDVLQHPHITVDIVEDKLARLEGRLQLRLGVVGIDGQLTIILEIGEGLVDRTARLSTGHPIHQGVGGHIGNGGVGHGVPHADDALIVRRAGLPGHKLEFTAHLITDPAAKLLIEPDGGGVRCRATQGVVGIGLNLVQKGLVGLAVDGGGIRPVGQRHPDRCGQGGLRLEVHPIVAYQSLSILNGLGVSGHAVHIGGHIPQVRLIHIGGHHNGDVVASHAAILSRGQGVGGLDGPGAQAVAVDGGGVGENLPQGEHLGVVVGIAENGFAVLLKLPGGDGENLTLRAPAQLKRRCRKASVREGRRRPGHTGKIDIVTGQDLVLDLPGAAAQRHISSPFLSCTSQSARPPHSRCRPCRPPAEPG